MTKRFWPELVWLMVALGLAWPLRGQFGHFRGALIPGALAAAVIAVSQDSLPWYRAFGWAVVLGSAGFSVGGHFGYGTVIDRVLSSPRFIETWPDLVRIFWTGALWGGFGATALGFGFSEHPWRLRDGLVYGGVIVVGWLALAVLRAGAYDLWIVGGALAAVQAYNARFQRSRMVALFGAAGTVGFGLGFLIAVLVLYAGHRHWFGTGWPWWHLRDQIFGGIGGASLAWAAHTASRRMLTPAPQPANAIGWRIGLCWYLVAVPLANTLGVVGSWIDERPIASLDTLRWFGGALWWGGAGMTVGVWCLAASMFDERLPQTVCWGTILVMWWLIVAAVSKEVIPLGWGRWEPGFTLFLVSAGILTVWCVRRSVSAGTLR